MDTKTLLRSLGGQTKVARRLDIAMNRVNSWIIRDGIPGEFYVPIWHLCLEKGIDWRPPGADGIEALIFKHYADALVDKISLKMRQTCYHEIGVFAEKLKQPSDHQPQQAA